MIGTYSRDGIQYASGAVLNPKTPFKDNMKRLRFGDLIVITGRTASKGKRFDINLCNELDNGKTEYVMHLNPRFNENRVVRNSTINEKWGPEEHFGGLGGLESESDFESVILIHTDCYKIAFNGKHYCDYRHRLPYTSVNKLLINGEVHISSIYVQPGPVGQLKHRDGSQPLAMPAFPGSPQKSLKAVPVDIDESKLLGGYHLAIPYLATFDGMNHDQAIYISGVPHKTAQCFTINLRLGADKTSDIGFHMCPHYDSRTTVVNDFVDGEWGNQKSLNLFPFKRGIHFDLMLRCDADVFKVSVNNSHYTQFQHRVGDLSKISSLEIAGDLDVVHVRMR